MGIVEEAFYRLWEDGKSDYEFSIKYSGKFSDYNANCYMKGKKLEFRLSFKWKEVNDEIQIGLIQHLLLKLFNEKKETMNLRLYDNFIRSLHLAISKDNVDDFLLESFNRVNSKYFGGMMENPNLVWGQRSVRKLGSYDYHTDTITMSTIFKKGPLELLDYVMYHEMLHKKLKFKSGRRNIFHTKEFREWEKKYDNFELMERKLSWFTAKKRIWKW